MARTVRGEPTQGAAVGKRGGERMSAGSGSERHAAPYTTAIEAARVEAPIPVDRPAPGLARPSGGGP